MWSYSDCLKPALLLRKRIMDAELRNSAITFIVCIAPLDN